MERVEFQPFANPPFHGVRPLPDQGNRQRWQRVAAGACNANVRVYLALARSLPQ